MTGTIHLVGAGPGDPDLLTLRAARRIAEADVILHDQLVTDAILALARPDCRLICVGKVGGGPTTPQDQIEERMIAEALLGARVVRLKGGDPYVFGRGGEEVLRAAEHGIPVEVVPGISSAFAGPASVGIPVTHRGVSTSVTVVTGQGAGSDDELAVRWGHLVQAGGTLVFLMGLRALPRIVEVLRAAGAAEDLPAAIVSHATRPTERVWTGTLATIEGLAATAGPASPTLLVFGEVVRLQPALAQAVASLPPTSWPLAAAV